MNDGEIVERGKRVVRMERDALSALEGRLGDEFACAVRLIAESPGRVVVAGVGKSGLIGHKIAATLTSTGTPASFLHPVDSVHGDLGIVSRNDVAILISKSGESDELLGLLSHLKAFGVRTIAITGDPASALARNSDVSLDAAVGEEACPHDLAPTTSTTAALALGDALAVALLQEKGFKREDFARLHPGGALGRQLVVRVEEIMLREDLPVVRSSDTVSVAFDVVARQRGIAIACDDNGRVQGLVTAGDMSRFVAARGDLHDTPVDTVMTRAPQVAHLGELASAVAYRMEQFGIMATPVLDDGERLVGVVHLHDLMRARVA
ncbi:MAG TPA: KpsF/GutQ family sugar-phosphate isomerase [Gemmatimonadaceae bacterium]|jgi:arabinose-5-phosphate isomerase|nr:KpsF/GutQ family sugar-phosphate isomerase [Gemmatimonadaceae bacterium]